MSKPLCRLCPKPAHFNFREGILLCAECAADVLELCKIDSRTCGDVEGHVESGQGTRKGSNVKPFDSATLNSEVGIKPGPQDFIISPEQPKPNPDQQSQDQAKHHTPVNAEVVSAVHDGIPEMFRRSA